MSLENRYLGGPGSDQTPDMLSRLPCIHHESGCKKCTFLIDHRVVEEYLKYWRLLAYGFCKIHVYILLGSQKTPEGSTKVLKAISGLLGAYLSLFGPTSVLYEPFLAYFGPI